MTVVLSNREKEILNNFITLIDRNKIIVNHKKIQTLIATIIAFKITLL